jgi:hypothetical protein
VHIDPKLTQAIVFTAICVIIWWPGNLLIWQLWRLIAWSTKVEVGVPTRLAPTVGGLERVLYVYAVMSGKYEVITGWLVMKAFFGWIGPERRRAKKGTSASDEISNTYNGFILGTLLSLLLGLAAGLAASLTTSLINPSLATPSHG